MNCRGTSPREEAGTSRKASETASCGKMSRYASSCSEQSPTAGAEQNRDTPYLHTRSEETV